jgi:hypothetical protein
MVCRLLIELDLLPILLWDRETALEASRLGARDPMREWILDWETPTTWAAAEGLRLALTAAARFSSWKRRASL